MIFKGLGTSYGKIKGIVKIVNHKNFAAFKKGEILVIKSATPTMTPLLIKAKAVITEYGGLTCHAAIISREFGIPSIVGVSNITKLLKDGNFVEVNATKGFIRLIK